MQLVFSPGELFEALRNKPLWGGALLLSGAMIVLSVVLIPGEIWIQTIREQATARGGEVPPFLESAGALFSLFSALAGVVVFFLMTFVMAGIVTFVFAFVLGDEGRFVQYLSVVSHGLILSAMGGLLLLPLRVLQKNPELTLNLGTFFVFLTEGYLFRVLRFMDLFGLWASVVMAIGVSAVDPRRGLVPALVFFLGLTTAFALVFGIFGG